MDFLREASYFIDWFRQQPIVSLFDILLVTAAIFSLFYLIRGTRAVQVLRGLLVFGLLLSIIAAIPGFTASRWLLTNVGPALFITIPVIFQPEIRRLFDQLGRFSNVRLSRSGRQETDESLVATITNAALKLSRRRHGALIIFEKDTGLQEFIDTGITLDAEPSADLLLTIFQKDTELHDGAVIIRNGRVAAAATVMPLSSSSLSDRQMGLRHRASLGISEVSDAVALVVSEETGHIAIAHNGRILRRQDPARLDTILEAFLQSR